MTDHPHSNFAKYIDTPYQPFILAIMLIPEQVGH